MGNKIGGISLFVLFICFIIFAFVFSKYRTGKFFNIITPFIGLWTIMLFISKFMSGYLYKVDDKTYNIIYLFVVVVLLGFLVISKKFTIKRNEDQLEKYLKNGEDTSSNKIMLTIQLVFLVILFLYLIKYNSIKAVIPVYQLRIVRYQIGSLFSNGMELLFYNYVIATFVELMGLISIVKIIMTYRVSSTDLLGLLSLLVFSLIGLGRFGLFNAVYFILATFFLLGVSFYKKVSFEKNGKKIIFLSGILIIMVITMVLIGSTRQGKQLTGFSDFFLMLKDSFSQAIVYFIGPFRSLDYYFHYSNNFFNDFLYGRAFFSGLDEFFSFAFSLIGLGWTSSNSIISNLTSIPISIGEGINFNAFYTAIFNAYLDAGYYGVVFLGLILGIIAGLIWNFHLRKRNFYSFLLVIYFSLMLISTVYRFEFQQFKSYGIIFILICLANKKERKSVH